MRAYVGPTLGLIGGIASAAAVILSIVKADDYTYVTEAEPLWETVVVEVGDCTPQQTTWASATPGRCAVKLDDGSTKVVRAPVMVGMKFITCPEKTNNIDNERCVYWNGARPKIKNQQENE